MKYFVNKKIANRKVGNGWLFENGIGLNETSYEIYNICNEKSTDEEILEKIKKIYIIQNRIKLLLKIVIFYKKLTPSCRVISRQLNCFQS